MNNLTEEQSVLLNKTLNTLLECETFFRLRDRMNARLHLAQPRYSPITKEVTRTIRELSSLLEIHPDDGESEPENEESESRDGFAPKDY